MDWSSPPYRRYLVRTWLLMAVYVALNVAAIAGAFDRLQGRPAAWALAVAVAAPVVAQIWAVLAWMAESDEFVRAISAKRFILAAGAAIGLFSGWGFAESYAGAPHAPGWLIYPLFWVAFGVAGPFVRSSS